MGKNSLLKSTSKKKKSPSPKKDEEVKTTAKKKAAAKAKPAAKKKAAAKTKAKAKPKAAAKKKAVAKKKVAPKKKAPAKKAAPAAKKKLSIKELVQKKFDVWKPDKLFIADTDNEYIKAFSAPPIISGSNEEIKRIKKLLLTKFDMAEIKAAAEKAAAEKAAAEKAAAEKAAAEKAAAEKAAAEKAAAEKAAAEKAAAEKAAAEKAAAEKAAAEKAAAEKAAAEKAAAEKVTVDYGPPDGSGPCASDPMEQTFKYIGAVFVILLAFVIGASMVNQTNYYIKTTDGALEIWQGKFAPMGQEMIISLPGIQATGKIKDVYSKTDVFPVIFKYYLDKADTLLQVPGLPDYEGIKGYLNKALCYAVSRDLTEKAYKRLENIDVLTLLYKADVAADRATLADLKDANKYLLEAVKLNTDPIQANLIKQKIKTVNDTILKIKSTKTKVPPKPAHSK